MLSPHLNTYICFLPLQSLHDPEHFLQKIVSRHEGFEVLRPSVIGFASERR
jgi:hypothetical protein